MPRFLPVGKEAKSAAGFLLAALPALGALLTALAISGDLIGQMARNHPLTTFGAFACAAVAVFLGAVAAYGLQEGSRAERASLHVGIVVLGVALVLGVEAAVATWGDRAQPSVTVTRRSGSMVLDLGARQRTSLERPPRRRGGTAAARQGRPWAAHVAARAAPLRRFPRSGRRRRDPAQCGHPATARRLRRSRGPRLGGRRADAVLHAREHNRMRPRAHPAPQERPQLSVIWETFVRAPRLLVRLRARNLAGSPTQSMTLRVFGVTGDQTRRSLAEWSLAPNADGEFDRRLAVVVGRTYSDVCVVASISSRAPSCPAIAEKGTVWTQLAVPPVA